MDNLGELIQLYGLDNLPDELRKERELKRWRDIMEKAKYEQDYLPGYLKAEAEAREASIPERASFEHKRRVAMRWFGYYKKQRDFETALKIGHQYNKIACMCARKTRNGRC